MMETWQAVLGIRFFKYINPPNKLNFFFFWNDFLKCAYKKDQVCLLAQNFHSASCEEAKLVSPAVPEIMKAGKMMSEPIFNIFAQMMK